MALKQELDEHRAKTIAWKERVCQAEERRDQALPRASAQLAVLATEEALRNDPVDVSQRRDFDPETPKAVLNADETANLEGAELVIDSLRAYLEASLGLLNKSAPRIIDGFVTDGNV